MRRITALPYAAVVPSPLPLFPLNTVLVPGLVLPLHIFEPRYRDLIEALLARPVEDDREFGIVAVRDGHDVHRDGLDALYPVGTATIVRQAERLDDGRFDIVTTGSRRFRLVEVDTSEPLVRGQVEFLADATEPADEALALQVAIGFRHYREALSGQVTEEVEPEDELPDDPTVLSYLVTAAMVLPTDQRQDLLAAPSTGERLRRARRLLRHETALISALSAVPAIDLGGPSASPN
jgi:Lon protease-like protein